MFQFTLRAFWFNKRSVIGDTPQILIKQNTPAETEHNGPPVRHTVCTQCQNTMFFRASYSDEKNKEKSVKKLWQMERTRGKCSTSRKSMSSMWHVLANKRLRVHASGVGSHSTVDHIQSGKDRKQAASRGCEDTGRQRKNAK